MILGMAHRGRLNTLAIVFDKPYDEIFAEFQDLKGDAMIGVGGDVKYHLGTTIHKQLNNGNMELTILPNPSHLETVNPVVYGTVRAIQDFTKDSQANKAFGVIIHGDAAFAG
jgi:2-oxoglutarate dehydrogenase E1 component